MDVSNSLGLFDHEFMNYVLAAYMQQTEFLLLYYAILEGRNFLL